MNRLSHSSIRMYSECGRKYKFHYIDRMRTKVTHGAFMFGLALDNALNTLLKTKNMDEATEAFEKSWALQDINGKLTPLSKTTIVAYAQKDYDGELLNTEDRNKYKEVQDSYNYEPFKDVNEITSILKEKKSEKGFNGLTDEEKVLLNYAHWLCLRRKGHILLKAYNDQVMPQIEEVLGIQEKFEIKNSEGDSVIGIGDIIVKIKGKGVYVMDNKTSTRLYASDSAMRSQQLILYHHAFKKKYNPDGVGFFVMQKVIRKNKTKICSMCAYDGSGGRHQTCNATPNGKRCGGTWLESIAPEGDINIILNTVPQAAERLVIETFDEANQGIKKGVFNPNLQACGDNDSFRCPFYRKCWSNDESELIKLEEGYKKPVDKQ